MRTCFSFSAGKFSKGHGSFFFCAEACAAGGSPSRVWLLCAYVVTSELLTYTGDPWSTEGTSTVNRSYVQPASGETQTGSFYANIMALHPHLC